MKIKSHKSKWAMALCAVAFFSFAAANVPAAGLLPDPILDRDKQPQTDEPTLPRVWWIDPISPASTDDGFVGSFSGAVVE